ncbi:hypothetical protein FOZ63_031720 [Perkinsus olseni]|uniref:Uncharacterized protein n=1 Tax=Perkinsus olseni TaxID=32597 RepID=A0A7J6P012_PEROL|nr:hypothetical protein FOZ60_001607 [Perkinsus olseni]KAF4736631.1 hypothetical protein FOZ62_028952 [Perkinsus olseni]KAF4758193.1 hypothetical protein FOZ63_031720 [Perkinsus olseni]
MMNLAATWVIVALVVVVTTAQDVGSFIYRADGLYMTYEVNEDHEVQVRCLVYGRPDRPPRAPVDYLFGLYPLSRVGGFSYIIEFKEGLPSVDDWYEFIGTNLIAAGWIEPDDSHQPAGILPGDLTKLTYKSGDSFSTSFRNKEVLFSRVTRSLIPGKFVYNEPVHSHLYIGYRIHVNETVEIQIGCDSRSTPLVRFKLSARNSGLLYFHYAAKSAGTGTLDQFLQHVRSVCPSQYLSSDDLSRVVVATERTIFIPFGAQRKALTKV